MTHHWTRREFALVAALTGRVRVLSLAQIRAGWFSPGTRLRQVGRDLERLIAAGLLQSTTWRVQPPPIAAVPLAVWRPGGFQCLFQLRAAQFQTDV